MEFPDAIERLERALRGPLPGSAAHALLAPRPRRPWPEGFGVTQLRHAAGLLLVVPVDGLASIVLTRRSDLLGRHRGQISLPGGVVEPGESFEHAALREAHEEIGLAVESVRTLGALTSIDIPVSGFRLHPIVATTSARLAFSPSQTEVAQVLEIDVDRLTDPGSVERRPLLREGIPVTAPTFTAAGTDIWGATAMVLAEFLVLLGWRGPTVED